MSFEETQICTQYGLTRNISNNGKRRNFLVIGPLKSISLSSIKDRESVSIHQHRDRNAFILTFKNGVRISNIRKRKAIMISIKKPRPFPPNFSKLNSQHSYKKGYNNHIPITREGYHDVLPKDTFVPQTCIPPIEWDNGHRMGIGNDYTMPIENSYGMGTVNLNSTRWQNGATIGWQNGANIVSDNNNGMEWDRYYECSMLNEERELEELQNKKICLINEKALLEREIHEYKKGINLYHSCCILWYP